VPEGDVVWRTARRLDRALTGRRLDVAELRWPGLSTAELTGRTVTGVVSRGKHLLTRLSGDLTVHSHLRMDGAWHILRPSAIGAIRAGHRPRGAPAPEHRIRAMLGNTAWLAVGYDLGMLDLVPTGLEGDVVGHLGPDLLDEVWDGDEALRRLIRHPQRPIGEALLDQAVAAGIGTFYLAETCFLTGTYPWDPVAVLPRPTGLLDRARALLLANRERVPQTTTGSTRPGENAYVYGRAGRPCRRCGTTIVRGEVGSAPRARVTYFCPHCQPARSGESPLEGTHGRG
jgi:endonuclease-8